MIKFSSSWLMRDGTVLYYVKIMQKVRSLYTSSNIELDISNIPINGVFRYHVCPINHFTLFPWFSIKVRTPKYFGFQMKITLFPKILKSKRTTTSNFPRFSVKVSNLKESGDVG